MNLGYGNNIRSTLASDINATQTIIRVMPGTGKLFAETLQPDAALKNESYNLPLYSKLTLTDEFETIFEICHLISVSGDNLTVIRGQEGTTAKGWSLNDIVSNFSTRGSENTLIQVEDLQSGKYLSAIAGGTNDLLTVSLPSTFFVNGENTFALRAPLIVFPKLTNTGACKIQLTVSGKVIGSLPVLKGTDTPLVAGDIVANVPVVVMLDPDKKKFFIINAATTQLVINEYLKYGSPEWSAVTSPYDKGAIVHHNNVYYVSIVDKNSATPGDDPSKWQDFIYRRAEQEEADDGMDPSLIITPPVLQQSLKNALGDITTELAPFLLPVGIIVAWGSTTPPDGWIEANGQAFDQAKNPKLLQVYPSGTVPDLRGRFVRGWAHGSTVDTDANRNILSTQEDAIRNITGMLDGGEAKVSQLFGENPTTTGVFQNEHWVDSQANGADQGRYGRFNGLSFDASRVVPVADENRPKNLALMYIVKTDQADNIKPDPTPTNIVITPSSLNVGTGATQQFTAQVFPVDLAPNFPVSWVSTDTSVGTIDGNGLFTAIGAGTTDVIASVSSGLSIRASVRVDILLTAIALDSIPDMVAGDSLELKITKTPADATEDITYSTTDSAVANITADGRLIAAGEGTATIGVTGKISGKNASQIVKVTAAPVEAEFLQIDNNLSEIAEAGEDAQAKSREHLGLGIMATKNSVITVVPSGEGVDPFTAAPGIYFLEVGAILHNAPDEAMLLTIANVTLTVYKTNYSARLSHFGRLNQPGTNPDVLMAVEWLFVPQQGEEHAPRWQWLGDGGAVGMPVAGGDIVVMSMEEAAETDSTSSRYLDQRRLLVLTAGKLNNILTAEEEAELQELTKLGLEEISCVKR